MICCIVWSLPNKRIIPVTNITDLVEYVLLPHKNGVTKPRGLNTFLGLLAELGILKGLIKNKMLLSDLIERKKAIEMQKILPRTRVIMRRVHRI